jgi:hypothetical protein
MAATGSQLADLSEEEVAEGIVRLAAAEAGAQRSEELAAAGAARTERGAEELATARVAARAARRAEAEGIAEGEASAAVLGATAAEAQDASRR